MVLSVILGLVVGALGLVPLYVSTRLVKGIEATNTYGYLGAFLAAVLISLVILVAPLLICKFVAESVVVGMAIAELVFFVVGVITFGLVRMIRNK